MQGSVSLMGFIWFSPFATLLVWRDVRFTVPLGLVWMCCSVVESSVPFVPTRQYTQAELAIMWTAASSRFGCECLCLNWEASLCERFRRLAARQQRI
jgi:hypothetical protein